MANNKGIIALNDLTFWFITGLTLNAIGLTPGLRGLHLLLFALDLFQLTQVMFALTLLFQGCAKKSILTFALWFWNQTWTILTLSPVSLANVSLTFSLKKWNWQNEITKSIQFEIIYTLRHGFWLISNDALNALLWAVVSIVLGLLGPLRPSCRGGVPFIGGIFWPLLDEIGLPSGLLLAIWIKAISFSKSGLQKSLPALMTNWSPFWSCRPQPTHTKQCIW